MAGNEIVGVSLEVEGGGAVKTIGDLRKELKAAREEMQALKEAGAENTKEFQDAAVKAKALNDVINGSNLRQQLRDAKQELILMQQAFGETSEQALNAARRVAQISDAMQDANSVAEAFNPDKKFAAFSQSLQGVVGGFTAAQGAMALFGVESDEVQKALLKVQAAMALSQGLNTLLESVQGFKNLGAVIKSTAAFQAIYNASTAAAAAVTKLFGVAVNTTATSFKVLRAAIISTGIGALIVGLGMLIEYMTRAADATDKAAKEQEDYNKKLAEGAQQSVNRSLKILNDGEKLEISRAKAQGKREADILAIQQKYQKLRIESQQTYIADLKRYNQDTLDASLELASMKNQVEISQNEQTTKNNEAARQEAEKSNEKQKAAAEKAAQERQHALTAALEAETTTREESNKRLLTDEEKEQYDLTLKFAERIRTYEKAGKDTTALVEAYEKQSADIYEKYRDEDAKRRAEDEEKKRQERQQASETEAQRLKDNFDKQLQAEDLSFLERSEILAQQRELILSDERLMEEERTRLLDENSKARIAIEKNEKTVRKQQITELAGVLNDAGELLGKQTAAGKALAIASTVISTYQAAQSAFTSLSGIPIVGPALGAVAAAVAVAGGIARIKKIAEVKIPGSSGGGVTGNISGGGAPIQPGIPISTTVTQLSTSTLQELNNKPLRAYVLESDIKEASNRADRIAEASKFE